MDGKWWTEEEKKELTKLIAKGYTGSSAAKALQEMFPARAYTRSMVGGQASRMGLRFASRAGASQERVKRKVVRKTLPRIPKKVIKMTTPPKPIAVIDPTKHCTILELNSSRCRYPMWHDASRATEHSLYCGGAVTEKPYCEIHNNIVLRQPNREPFVPFIVRKLPANPEKSTTL